MAGITSFLITLALCVSTPARIAAQTGDCTSRIDYTDQKTLGAAQVTTATSISTCDSACANNELCKSYHFISSSNQCWIQTAAANAYNRYTTTGISNHELPCRIPVAGCSYHVVQDAQGSGGTAPSTTVRMLHECHSLCVASATCRAWSWNSQSTTQRCLHYTSNTGTVTSATGLTYFPLLCRGCETFITYANTHTLSATAVSSATTQDACKSNCLTNSICKSFHWAPSDATSKCWIQTDATKAYARNTLSGVTNYELACRIPNAGCPFTVLQDSTGSGGTDGMQTQLGSCHSACVASSTCKAWSWTPTNTAPCTFYTTLSTPTSSSGSYYFQLACRIP